MKFKRILFLIAIILLFTTMIIPVTANTQNSGEDVDVNEGEEAVQDNVPTPGEKNKKAEVNVEPEVNEEEEEAEVNVELEVDAEDSEANEEDEELVEPLVEEEEAEVTEEAEEKAEESQEDEGDPVVGGGEEEGLVSEEEELDGEEATKELMKTTADLPPEDTNYIIVQKTFVGIDEDQIPEDFKITVTSGETVYELKNDGISSNPDIVLLNTGHPLILRWRINNAEEGTYTVSESGITIDGYDVEATGTGPIEVIASDLELTGVERWNNNNTQDWPMAEGKFFAASLTQQGVIVITRYSLSAGDRLAVENTLRYSSGFPNVWNRQYHFYSIEQQIETGDGFELNGAIFTYNFDTNMMHISDPSVWQQVASGDYDFIDAQNPEIEITNKYTPNTTLVNIKKLITGNFGDMNRTFDFTVSVNQGDEVTTFSLGHDETKSLTVRKGATLTLTEDSGDYEVTVMFGENEIEPNENGEYMIELSEDDVWIIVTNNYDIVIDTGISFDTLPYALILGTATMSLAIVFFRRRKIVNEDE